MSENITQSDPELWDLDEAIKQITHDGLLDTIEVMKQPNYFINQSIGSTLDKHAAEFRIKGMFNIAIRLGQIKDPDTPSNWIEWATRKGFDTDHLDSFINKQEINKPKTNNIPGNMPKIAIGRLVVTVAWEIERETGRRATAKEVLEKLQAWAENGQKHSDVLHPPPYGFRGVGVYWITSKSGKKIYSLAACEKTLEKWHKSRQ